MPINHLIRKDLEDFKQYQGALRTNANGIWLDANELPFANEFAESAMLNRYPEPQPSQLIERIAKLYTVMKNEVILARGSDELIDLLIRLFCQAEKHAVLICPPTFSMYANFAKLQAAKIIEVPLKQTAQFELNLPEIDNAWNESVKMIFICSPNNPTGHSVPNEEIFELCERYQNKSIIVVDEAYVEFANANSVIPYIKHYDNLVVLRTFSKAYGLAGLRCGMLFGQAELVSALLTILTPYPLPSLTATILMQALEAAPLEIKKQQIDFILAERKRVTLLLQDLPIVRKVWPSQANFLLVEFSNVQLVLAACQQNNIYVRSFLNESELKNNLRISIGTSAENNILIKVLSELSV